MFGHFKKKIIIAQAKGRWAHQKKKKALLKSTRKATQKKKSRKKKDKKDNKKKNGQDHIVFWLNITKNEVYLWYGHCSNLFGKIMREANFGNCVAKILRKSMRNEREMMWWRERETIEFWWCSYRNSYPKCNLPRRSAQKGERKIGIVCGNGVAKIVTEREKKIKAMELPKLWGRGKKKELWQLSCPKC